MTQEEFEQLKESIQTEGQHYPIIVSETLEVLDGHHRFRACLELGIEPDFEVKHFENKLLEKKFVIEANLRRRHLNNFQLVELAVPLLEIERTIAKKYASQNSQTSGSTLESTSGDSFSEFKPTEQTVETIAKKAGVSTRTLERGKKIIEQASEDDKQKLREGKTSISKIYREISPKNMKKEKKSEVSPSNYKFIHNKKAFTEIIQSMIEQDLFCPECGNKLFKCSQCNKSVNELINAELIKPIINSQVKQSKNEYTAQTEKDEYPLENDENLKDEFF